MSFVTIMFCYLARTSRPIRMRCPLRFVRCFTAAKPQSINLEYKMGSPERKALEQALHDISNSEPVVPIVVGNEQITTGDEQHQMMPHNHKRSLARYYYSNFQQVKLAIAEMMHVQDIWRSVSTADRCAIWKKCADIIEKEDRYILNAAIMLGQAKTYAQAEEDTCFLLQSLRMNAEFLQQMSNVKLRSNDPDRTYPTFYMRPIDGFVAAMGPFNQTYINANLAFCPALMGNIVLWKPSMNCVLSSFIVFQAIIKAGLPRGVISFMPTNSQLFLNAIANAPQLGGINFTGSVRTFRMICKHVAMRLQRFSSIPRVVGECGGMNFHFVHESANMETVVKATVQAAFDYSGQKCSSCSRLYVPESMWPDMSCALISEINSLKIGDPCDFGAYTSAVINIRTYDNIVENLAYAQKSPDVDLVCGGDSCKTLGYFIEPTVLRCKDPLNRLMTNELVGPVLCVFVYRNERLEEMLKIASKSVDFAYTGSIFARDDAAICHCLNILRMAAANIYINGRCTGSLGGQAPYSGNRLSGTKDQTNSANFLVRWGSPQLVEESLPLNTGSDCAAVA